MNLTQYIKQYSGDVYLDGQTVGTFDLDHTKTMNVLRLMPRLATAEVVTVSGGVTPVDGSTTYRFTVKPYMTKPSTPDFDLMARWNNNVPMPLRTMVGTIEKETRGMVYLNVHGDTDGQPVQHCLKCGKTITNPVSRYFGLGPECGQHKYTNPFRTEEELHSAVDTYRKTVLQKMTWTGWVPKSAITEQVTVTKL